ncbi:hypothetical protein DFQ28_010902, partial [Apophysomyces sp. BC1034]
QTDETSATLARRYLRYHPEAERYLALGDFVFYVFRPQCIRYIGGLGAMGWLDAAELDAFPPIPENDEQALIDALTPNDAAARDFRVLGVERFGVDWMRHGRRARVALTEPRSDVDELRVVLAAELRQYG